MRKIIDENRVKETLSEHYSGILFHLDGYYISNPEYDDGVDLTLRFNKEIRKGTKTFRNPSAESIDIQLKATTENKIQRRTKCIKYRIKVKSYNKLIERRKTSKYSLCVLIVFILPDLPEKWVTLKKNSLSLSNNAYWFIPPSTMDLELNRPDDSTIAIDIPTENKIEKNTFEKLFNLLPK